MIKTIGISILALVFFGLAATAQKAEQNAMAEETHQKQKKSMRGEMKSQRGNLSSTKENDDLEKMHRSQFELRREMVDADEKYYNDLLVEITPLQIEMLREEKRKKMRHSTTGKNDRMRMRENRR
ncbi:MAG: hypothetical protein LC664_05825 [Flavobacteriales bacterium]|nr:hypothetical protein [Flavobacteriales bacterium]